MILFISELVIYQSSLLKIIIYQPLFLIMNSQKISIFCKSFICFQIFNVKLLVWLDRYSHVIQDTNLSYLSVHDWIQKSSNRSLLTRESFIERIKRDLDKNITVSDSWYVFVDSFWIDWTNRYILANIKNGLLFRFDLSWSFNFNNK
jgi:hypothetical protein